MGDDIGGTMLVDVDVLSGEMVYDIAWLPDLSGFLYSATYINLRHITVQTKVRVYLPLVSGGH